MAESHHITPVWDTHEAGQAGKTGEELQVAGKRASCGRDGKLDTISPRRRFDKVGLPLRAVVCQIARVAAMGLATDPDLVKMDPDIGRAKASEVSRAS